MSRVSYSLHNYLRTHRLRASLTQFDIAALLGGSDDAMVRKHEQGMRLPDLMEVLAYEAIFGLPVSELFAGLDEAVRFGLRNHARRLLARLEAEERTSLSRIERVRRLAEKPTPRGNA